MQRFLDSLIFAMVDLWVIVSAAPEWRRLRRRQRRLGVRRIRVAAPRLADEKFLWRKVFDHDPRFVTLSDKIACKEWVAQQGINVRAPETLWVGTDANDIPEEVFQRPVYVKAAHGCQMNIPVLSSPDDRAAITAQANGFLSQDHGKDRLQWAYDDVPRRLLAEEAICPGNGLIEVKYYTFGKKVEQFVIRRDGPPLSAGRWEVQSDGSFVLSDERTAITEVIDRQPLPDVVEEGLELASRIGAHFDHIRVDTLTDGEELFLGELTVYSLAGRIYKQANRRDATLNRSWDLRRSWFLTEPQTGWRRHYAAALRRRIDRRERMGHGLA